MIGRQSVGVARYYRTRPTTWAAVEMFRSGDESRKSSIRPGATPTVLNGKINPLAITACR